MTTPKKLEGRVVIDVEEHATFNGASADGQFFSAAFSAVDIGASGNGGNVQVTSNSLEVINGAQLNASTFGTGNAGNVVINVRDKVVFDGTSTDGRFFSNAGSQVEEQAIGNGGNVQVTSNSLEVINGAQLNASTFGTGNAGNVVINARDSVVFDGVSMDGRFFSNAGSQVAEQAIGNGGNVQVTSNSLEVINGAQLNASTFGTGNAGNVVINARDSVVFDGVSMDGQFFSNAGSAVAEGAIGNGGDIQILTNSLEVNDSAQLTAISLGSGNAGNIGVVAETISLENDGIIRAETFSQGRGGDISIVSNQLLARSGGQIAAGSGREGIPGNFGPSGDINLVITDLIELDGKGSRQTRSGIFAETASANRAGNIDITTNRLLLRNGSAVSSGSVGSGSLGGDGGNITIVALESVDVLGRGNRPSTLSIDF